MAASTVEKAASVEGVPGIGLQLRNRTRYSLAMAADFQLLIGGAWVDAGDGGYDIVNPATEEVVGEAPNASVADAEAACAAAAEAFPAWSPDQPGAPR